MLKKGLLNIFCLFFLAQYCFSQSSKVFENEKIDSLFKEHINNPKMPKGLFCIRVFEKSDTLYVLNEKHYYGNEYSNCSKFGKYIITTPKEVFTDNPLKLSNAIPCKEILYTNKVRERGLYGTVYQLKPFIKKIASGNFRLLEPYLRNVAEVRVLVPEPKEKPRREK